MLEVGKRQLTKAFAVVRVPAGEVYRLMPNESPVFAVVSKMYGWRGYAYYIGSGTVLYTGYENIGTELSKNEVDELAAYYSTMSEIEAKAKIKKKITDKVFGWDD